MNPQPVDPIAAQAATEADPLFESPPRFSLLRHTSWKVLGPWLISFPNPVGFITKHVGFVFTRVLYFCLCRPFSSSHCTWRNFFADNCKFWTLQCSLFFGHTCTGIAGICFSLNFILVTELSAQTISGMNAVSNINLSSWYVHRDV